MKIGLIGLGDIAQKAYLPVLGHRTDVSLYLSTRDETRLQQIGAAYRIHEHRLFNRWDTMLEIGLDAVFVHAATEAHDEIVKQCIVAGLHVFVDKPVTYNLVQTEKRFELAKQHRRLLMVGFNRRYAPLYRGLFGEGAPDITILQKNRVGLPGDVRTFVLDDFIHVVDTLRWLHRAREFDFHVQSKRTMDGKLANVIVQLSHGQRTAIGIMNRDSGAVEETLEWMKDGEKCKVTNLRELVRYKDNQARHEHAGDWATVGDVRGFHAMVDTFLQSVHRMKDSGGEAWDEFTATMEDDLSTHRICEDIIQNVESQK